MGAWRDPNDGLIIHFQDDGQIVTGTCDTPSHSHNFTGTHSSEPNRIDVSVVRTSRSSGRSTALKAYYQLSEGGEVVTGNITGTDGLDDLAVNFTEPRTLRKYVGNMSIFEVTLSYVVAADVVYMLGKHKEAHPGQPVVGAGEFAGKNGLLLFFDGAVNKSAVDSLLRELKFSVWVQPLTWSQDFQEKMGLLFPIVDHTLRQQLENWVEEIYFDLSTVDPKHCWMFGHPPTSPDKLAWVRNSLQVNAGVRSFYAQAQVYVFKTSWKNRDKVEGNHLLENISVDSVYFYGPFDQQPTIEEIADYLKLLRKSVNVVTFKRDRGFYSDPTLKSFPKILDAWVYAINDSFSSGDLRLFYRDNWKGYPKQFLQSVRPWDVSTKIFEDWLYGTNSPGSQLSVAKYVYDILCSQSGVYQEWWSKFSAKKKETLLKEEARLKEEALVKKEEARVKEEEAHAKENAIKTRSEERNELGITG